MKTDVTPKFLFNEIKQFEVQSLFIRLFFNFCTCISWQMKFSKRNRQKYEERRGDTKQYCSGSQSLLEARAVSFRTNILTRTCQLTLLLDRNSIIPNNFAMLAKKHSCVINRFVCAILANVK